MNVYVRICDRNNAVVKQVRKILKNEVSDCKLSYEKEVTAVDESQKLETVSSTLDKIENADICVFVTDPFGNLTLQSLFEYGYALKTHPADKVFRVKPPYLWEKGTGFIDNNF